MFMGLKRVEIVFANTYLPLRENYLNELDKYADVKGSNSSAIIQSIGLDPQLVLITLTTISELPSN